MSRKTGEQAGSDSTPEIIDGGAMAAALSPVVVVGAGAAGLIAAF
jgi:hypothetical protein